MVRATAVTVPDDPAVETPEENPPVGGSAEAQQLIDAGARPVDSATVAMLIEQMQAMQERINSLSQAAGVPSDPIDAVVQALKQHVDQIANAHPNHDFSELKTVLGDLPPSDELNKDVTELVKDTVADHVKRFGNIRHDLGYIEELASGLHSIFVKKAAGKA
jgi:hypothetical protein